MKKIILLINIIGILAFNIAIAQPSDIAPPQTNKVSLVGGTIHIGNGQVIEKGCVTFEKGKITYVGNNTPSGEIIDVNGKHLYPGFIDPATTLGLNEIGAVRATRDNYEVGELNPSIRSIIAYNTDDRTIPTIMTNGILLSNIIPQNSMLGGWSSIVQLNAWNYEDALYALDQTMTLYWPNKPILRYAAEQEKAEEREKAYQQQIDKLSALFDEASMYKNKINKDEKNLKLEALQPLIENRKTLLIFADRAKEIMDACLFAKSKKIRYAIVGASDAHLIIDFLQKENVTLILGKVHDLPAREDEDIDMPFKQPSMLYKAGINFCIGMSNSDAWNHRNIPFQAGTAVAYGLPYEQAVKSITLSAAEILGIADKTGSVEVGKDANIIVSEGDALDMRTSKVTQVYIQGRKVKVENTQIYQYERYKEKYGLK